MKKRTLIISVLLVAALALGIGYAALSDTLSINGTIKTDGAAMENTFDSLVYFTNATVTNDPAVHITANVSATYGGDEASYTITGMNAVGDEVTMEFVIHNAYSETVWVTLAAHDENPYKDYIQISNNYNDTPIKIDSLDDAKFTITVTVIELTNATIDDLVHNISFNVSDVDPASGN